MFMADDRQPKMRAVIMAEDAAERRAALDELLPLQQGDFEGLFEAMDGLPVTIRLLDPPLHEFLPDRARAVERRSSARASERAPTLAELEHELERVRALEEVNPMLGTRGVRLGLLHPDDLRDAGASDLPRGVRGARAQRQAAERRDHDPAGRLRARARAVRGAGRARRGRARARARRGLLGRHDDRAAARLPSSPARIAREADFFSFGTNDLTQTALGFSRDDIEARILAALHRPQIFERSPFETLDAHGVGAARADRRVARAQGASRASKLGICGEHGGDPDSIDFFHGAGLDYVSCSPFRVPIARVAAAQAAVTAARG